MLKKTITYTDFNDEERTEDFYFFLSKAKLAEMEFSTNGGMKNKLERLINEKDGAEICKLIKDLIMLSYGKKSDDGKRFMQTPEIAQEFLETEAYSELFMELTTNAEAAAAFVNGIIPKDLKSKIDELQKK